jgi:hypothetical protein
MAGQHTSGLSLSNRYHTGIRLVNLSISIETASLSLIEPDIAQDLAIQVGDGGEEASVDNIALEFTEPDLDLIEPRRVGGREVQHDIRMLPQEVFHEVGFVRRKVIQDDVYLALGRLRVRTSMLREATN